LRFQDGNILAKMRHFGCTRGTFINQRVGKPEFNNVKKQLKKKQLRTTGKLSNGFVMKPDEE